MASAPEMSGSDPCNFYGTAAVNGVPVEAGTEITAWVEGVEVASVLTGAGTLPDDEYNLNVFGEQGDVFEVSFKNGDWWANETANYVWLGMVCVNLTASSDMELVEGANIICYPGATGTLAEALTNIGPSDLDVAEIIWARAFWTNGQWWFYNVAQDYAYPPGEFTHLEHGRAYLIVVSENCTWELL